MPFTLSHAAAVLPGIRRSGRGRGPLLASALVAGSFAPDMTYFAASAVPGAMGFGTFTHSLPGVLTLDAVVTAALVGGWLLLREPLVALLPGRARGRVYRLVRGEDWRAAPSRVRLVLWFWVSAVIGSLTHVVWDAFTHLDRFGTDALPWLTAVVAGFPFYLYVQYGSSAVALAVLAWFVAGALRRLPGGAAPAAVPVLGRGERAGAFALLGAAVAAGVAQRVARWFTYFDAVHSPFDIIPTICFGAGTGLLLALPVYALLVRLRHRGDRTPTGPDARTPVSSYR
ncbi:DUF4184 family protein [Streptomyces sp. NPDC101118]|uniref:DUF4184 family protein n=1 Tax=Streptomyces sp. NPDC101118 TaxID=3366109 RepID=UPI00381CA38F